MSKNFDASYAKLQINEGGFKKDAKDRMDWDSGKVGVGKLVGTNMGISAGSYPNEDILNMTVERSKFLYKRDFWDRISADTLESHVAFQLFDACVNHGPGNGIRMMQRALGVNDDGAAGPITLGKLSKMEPKEFMIRFNADRLRFFTRNSTWDHNSEGWALRIVAMLLAAVEA